MKLLIEFEQKDFETFRKFQDSLNRQLGNTYAGTNSAVVYFDYPPELVALLRPQEGNDFKDKDKLKEMRGKLQSGAKLAFEVDSCKPQ
jgi:hypothetical protein